MYIASQKRKENIAEYLLYMWQIEDLIRANSLDIDKIKVNIIDKFGLDHAHKKEMTEWYESLIDMMRREEVEKSGHLQINKNVLARLSDIHNRLLKDPKFQEYTKQFYATLPFIVELRAKAGADPKGEIETCFNALYGTLMLKLKGAEISADTQKALQQISRMIAMLSNYCRMDDKNELFKDDDDDNQ